MRHMIATCVLLTAITGFSPQVFGGDSDPAPTMSSLNTPVAAPSSEAGNATTPVSDPGATSGGPITHATVPPAASPGTKTAQKAAKQGNKSHLGRAVKALDAAIEELSKGPDDFGGHQAEAITACEAARDQLKLAIAYRQEHPVETAAPKP